MPEWDFRWRNKWLDRFSVFNYFITLFTGLANVMCYRVKPTVDKTLIITTVLFNAQLANGLY